MTREQRAIFESLKNRRLPPGWVCELAWPYRDHTHLVAPKRKGGVIVRDRDVVVQLPGDGPCAETITVACDIGGHGWLAHITKLAVDAAFEYADQFPKSARGRS